MKSLLTIIFCATIFLLAACVKQKEPIAKICPEEPQVITTKDTLVLDNCSEYFETQLWNLPGGIMSTQNSVAFASPVPGKFVISLKVSNQHYANEYYTERNVEVVKAP